MSSTFKTPNGATIDSRSVNSPNNISTLYIRNLNEKVSKETLRKKIEDLFNSYHLPVISITIFKNLQLRGQAFVTLYSHEHCLKAIELLNTTIIFEKPLDIYLARSNSDTGAERLIQNQPQETQSDLSFDAYLEEQRKSRLTKREARASSTGAKSNKRSSESTAIGQSGSKKQKIEPSAPNKTIILTKQSSSESLSSDETSSNLNSIFGRYEGFLTVTYVAVKKVALVDFVNEIYSSRCMEALTEDGVANIGGEKWLIKFAK
ncbi:hypothetical protein CANARDRAFT_5201 [[Candida] arabinofermentans NRRL YB-2248]|uniref:RRM domain-containing protein n=1 Tax=[Candida] arabinofermentans NRRL YB-2248 TaxID=983967 RepID=A0A1E4T807_9ASCO|nr:hypothetical protein CANARDRAFT_5201 [[Candida] arabinofermentans NRRL YB-2248]